MKGKRALVVAAVVMMMAAILVVTAVATTGNKTATLYYNNIGIKLDGEEIVPKDANGNTVEPFIIDGTTYLPVRAVSGALGLDVAWDSTTDTVVLTTKKADTTPAGQTIVDEDGIKVIYKGTSVKYERTYYDFYIENNTEKVVMTASRDSSVNGFMGGFSFVEELQPGKKANVSTAITSTFMEENGITSVTEIEFLLVAYNSDDYSEPYIVEKTITINP